MAARLMIRIRTFDLKTNELENDRTVDINNADTEKWFKQHCIWAWYNGKGVQTCNETDWIDEDED